MFGHCFKYAFKSVIRNKHLLIWTIIFPIALGTFMYMAFGNLYEADMKFHTINVDVVKVSENKEFENVLDNLTKANGDEDALLKVTYESKETALEHLTEGTAEAVIYEDKEISLAVAKSDIKQEIVRSIVEQYNKTMDVIEDAAKKDPTKLQEVLNTLTENTKTYITEKKTSNATQDLYVSYYYAVLAMSCLFASYASMEFASKLTASVSELGKRRSLTMVSKGTQAIATFIAMWIVHSAVECLTLGYLSLLGVQFGDKVIFMIPILLTGSAVGISLGIFIGSIPKLGEGLKSGLCTAISMSLCVMADLCANGVKDMIEHSLPIINRVNPAALISDAFYSLNVFDTYDRYIRNISILTGMSVVFLIISFILLRRNRSASL